MLITSFLHAYYSFPSLSSHRHVLGTWNNVIHLENKYLIRLIYLRWILTFWYLPLSERLWFQVFKLNFLEGTIHNSLYKHVKCNRISSICSPVVGITPRFMSITHIGLSTTQVWILQFLTSLPFPHSEQF